MDSRQRDILTALQRGGDMADHVETLRFLVFYHAFGDILELGVRTGVSTLAILLALQEDSDGDSVCRLTSLDREPCLAARQAVERAGLGGRWTFLQRDALNWTDMPQNKFWDMIFVDLDHGREETERVLEVYAPRVKCGGWMVFHDTISHPELWAALEVWRGTEGLAWNMYHWRHCAGLAAFHNFDCRAPERCWYEEAEVEK